MNSRAQPTVLTRLGERPRRPDAVAMTVPSRRRFPAAHGDHVAFMERR